MHFKVGEKVGLLYESGSGVIKKLIDSKSCLVEDEFGFERPFLLNEIVRIYGNDYKLPDDADLILNDDDSLSSNKHTVRKGQLTGYKKPIDIWEIDLHIEEITDSHSGLSNFEILSKQLKEFKNFYKRAKSKFIRKIVVIHGVGEGVLKDEVRLFLSKQEGIEYFDADFREYGKGATSVEIHYNID